MCVGPEEVSDSYTTHTHTHTQVRMYITLVPERRYFTTVPLTDPCYVFDKRWPVYRGESMNEPRRREVRKSRER